MQTVETSCFVLAKNLRIIRKSFHSKKRFTHLVGLDYKPVHVGQRLYETFDGAVLKTLVGIYGRINALNLMSLQDHGTIEVRVKHGSNDFLELNSFVLVCLLFVSRAVSMTVEEIDLLEVDARLQPTPRTLLQFIMPGLPHISNVNPNTYTPLEQFLEEQPARVIALENATSGEYSHEHPTHQHYNSTS